MFLFFLQWLNSQVQNVEGHPGVTLLPGSLLVQGKAGYQIDRISMDQSSSWSSHGHDFGIDSLHSEPPLQVLLPAGTATDLETHWSAH